jgi:signal transduction histidine kinase
MLKAAAARRLATTAPAESAELLRELERNVAAAIADIRGLVDELRPPVLDGRGLVGAFATPCGLSPDRQRAAHPVEHR